MVRVLVLALLAVSLGACETPPDRPAPLAPADSAREALRDSLYEAEMARRQRPAPDIGRWSRDEQRKRHNAALWDLAALEDWSTAHDTVLADAIMRMAERALGPDGERTERGGQRGARIPLASFRDGVPRRMDRLSQVIDSVAARYRIADRVRAVSTTDTLIRAASFAGFEIYTVQAETALQFADGTRRALSGNGDLSPSLSAVLAVRNGQAQPLRVGLGAGWPDAQAVTTPLGRLLILGFTPVGSRYTDEWYVERQGGQWRDIGRGWDLQHNSVPPFALVYRDREIDLEAAELRGSVEAPYGVGVDGCLVSPIVRRRGRLTTAAAVWHRDVADCYEYSFQPSTTVRRDTSRMEVTSGRLAVHLRVHARPDTTTRYDWRLLDPAGRERWAGAVARGRPPDSTYHFQEPSAVSGTWQFVETKRTEYPRYNVTWQPPAVSRGGSYGR